MIRLFAISIPALLLTVYIGYTQLEGATLQKKVDAAKWDWSEYENRLLYCVLHNLQGYEVRITRPKGVRWEQNSFQIAIFDDATAVFKFQGHAETVFAQNGEVLFIAELSPIATGCDVLAYDLKQRKQLWKTQLNGNPPEGHSQYRQQVIIRNKDGVIVVYGKESNGRYIEYLDAQTGKIVGHVKLPPEP